MLFQAVMKFLSRLVEFKILVNWGMVHSFYHLISTWRICSREPIFCFVRFTFADVYAMPTKEKVASGEQFCLVENKLERYGACTDCLRVHAKKVELHTFNFLCVTCSSRAGKAVVMENGP